MIKVQLLLPYWNEFFITIIDCLKHGFYKAAKF